MDQKAIKNAVMLTVFGCGFVIGSKIGWKTRRMMDKETIQRKNDVIHHATDLLQYLIENYNNDEITEEEFHAATSEKLQFIQLMKDFYT